MIDYLIIVLQENNSYAIFLVKNVLELKLEQLHLVILQIIKY